MLRLVLQRLLATIPIMVVVATVVFMLLRLAPGDPAHVIAGDLATDDAVAAIRKDLGLDKPLITQYLRWMGAVLTADLGTSVISRRPVTELIGARLAPTLSLAACAIVVTIFLALP